MSMSNPLYEALGGNRQSDMMGDLQRFIQQMQGKNPREEITRMLKSGSITQEQLNFAQQRAQQIMNTLGMMKR